MKILNDSDAVAWLNARGIEQSRYGGVPKPAYREESRTLEMSLDLKPAALIARAHRILLQDLPDTEPMYFAGALVWIRSWGFWNEDSESLGELLMESVRKSVGDPNILSFSQGPIHLFSNEELVAAHAAFVLPMLFQWDATIIPESGNFIVQISHHLRLEIEARSEALLSEIEARLVDNGWLSSVANAGD